MKTTMLSILSVASLAILTSCGDGGNKDAKETAKDQNEQKFDNTKMEDDTKFAVAAADGGMMEVQLGKLAQTNASSQQVKDFGRQMVDDHSKGNDELKALAQKKNITLPAAISDKHQKDYDDLAKKKGADFDKAYIDNMVDDHKEDIDEFQKEADKGADADIKAWAAGKVPVLQHHLMMAKAAQDAVKK
jgi:putative membrane protein